MIAIIYTTNKHTSLKSVKVLPLKPIEFIVCANVYVAYMLYTTK